MTDLYPIGTIVRITRPNIEAHGMLAKIVSNGNRGQFPYRLDSLDGTNPEPLSGHWSNTSIEEVTPARPVIDFSLSRNKTASQYADHLSRKVKGESRHTLRMAGLGQKVDAYRLNEAILDAMRAVARLDDKSKAAHLGYIVQAVIENHADALPAYAEGERSRKVAELETKLAELETKLAELDASSTEQIAEREALLHKGLHKAADKLEEAADLIDEQAAKLATAEEGQEELGAVLGYALDVMGKTKRQRVLGFWDGLVAVIEDVEEEE